jgi:DNA-directed RNA polymerase subunit F
MENKVVEMKPVSLYEVKEVLKARKAEKELSYEQDLTMKYVDRFAKLTEKQTTDLVEKLKEVEFLKNNDVLIYEIINVLPTRLEQLQLMVPKGVSPSEEELKAVLALTEKFAEKVE